jgi:4-hydroxy-3-methylbut-2-enyl diphosphate reductase
VAYVTQTTLSVDDTAEIVEALKARFPDMAAPHRDDICYATTNRQEAVKSIAGECDVLLVIGSANSSNSVRLVEVGLRAGAPKAFLIDDADDLDLAWLAGARTIGVTAGASAPEDLVQGVIRKLSGAFAVTVEEIGAARETVSFKLPRALLA